MQITANFLLSEFYCKSGRKVPFKYRKNVNELAKYLQVLRDELKAPITINSGYRDPYYNNVILKLKGYKTSRTSKHLEAKAADIVVKGYTPYQVAKTIIRLIKQGKMKQGGVGLYKSFVHYDTRGTKARWGNFRIHLIK